MISEDGDLVAARKLICQNLRVQAMPAVLVQVVND